MEQSSILEHIGLTERESLIYLALIECGPSTVAAISHKTCIHRPAIYQALPAMETKRLVTKALQGRRRLYVAAPPETLEAIFEGLSAQFRELVPRLRSTYETLDARPIVKYLTGKREIATIFTDLVTSLKRGDIFYRYSSAQDGKRAESFLPTDYAARRDAKRLERYVITSEARAREKKPRLERALKVVPKEYDLFDQDVTQIMYGTKVAYIDYNTETAIVIENSKIAEFQKKLFLLLYRKL